MIHRWARPEQLAVARIAVFGIWFLRIATTPYSQYEGLPPELIEPSGVMRLLPVEALLSSPEWLLTLKVSALLACALCMVGVRPWRPIAVVAVLLIVGHDGAMKSIQGFINHGQLAALYAAMILAVSPAADALSIRGRRRVPPDEWRYGGPLLACASLIAVAYSFIGVRRLVWGGADVFTDGSILRWVVAKTLEHAAYDFDVGLLALELPLLGGVLAAAMLVVTALEALSPLALRHDRFRLVWLAVIAPFHVSTMFLMNIFFWENLILLAVFFTGFAGASPRRGGSQPPPERAGADAGATRAARRVTTTTG